MASTQNKHIEIKVRKQLNSDFFGAYNTKFIGNGLEFRDLRNYVHGDSVKHIDWKQTAKHGEVFIKNYEQERDLQLLFVLDVSRSMQFGSKTLRKIDTLLQIFYTLGFSASSAGDSIGAYVMAENTHSFVEFEKGETSLFKIESCVNDMQYISRDKKQNNSFELQLKNLEKLKIHNSFLCICTDTIDFNISLLKGLAVRNQILFCSIFDSFENRLWSETASLGLSNVKQSLFGSFHSPKKRSNYIKLRKEKKETFKKSLHTIGVDYLDFDEESFVVQKFLAYFNRVRV